MGLIDDLMPNDRSSFILFGLIVLLIIFILWNPSCSNKLAPIESLPTSAVQIQPSEESQVLSGPIRRISRIERGGDYIEDLFFIGDKQVAQQKIEKGIMISHQGDKITGKVNFFNELDQTRGVANYSNNFRNGLSTTFFSNGKILLEEEYKRGQIIQSKEYYADGKLRCVTDYSEALKCSHEKEVGVGKLYYPSGKMKYEWNLTWRQKGGFKKTYNTDGSLRYVAWFNEQCKKIKEEFPNSSKTK